MREILFRAKRLDNGEWVEGDLRHGGYANNDSETYIMKSDYALHNIPVDPETVCQFTGLNDMDGVKIFEGDVVKATVLENSGFGTRRYTEDYIIKYHEKYCYFYLSRERNNLLFDGNWGYAVTSFEVIGNIFDNPELMEGETDVHM